MQDRSYKAKILTIDDEAFVRQSIAVFLEDSGYIVLEAADGKSAFDLIKTELPDLIITDLQIPHMHGLEILSILQRNYPEIPVIVVSGAGDMQAVIQALRSGAWDYFTKPIVDFTLVERAINRALEHRLLQQQNAAYKLSLEKNLKFLEQDAKAGRGVQVQLLPPQNLTIKNYHLHYGFIPSLYLSGDFLDYFPIDGNYIGFYITDVSGHGASSACITIYLKSLINQYLNQKINLLIRPDLLLASISSEIHRLNLDKYLTIFYGVINIIENKLFYSIAGHYPWPILFDGKEPKFLTTSTGFPAGIKPDAKYELQKIELPKTFSLSCYSDGILELLNPKFNNQQKERELFDLTIKYNNDISAILNSLNITNQAHLPDDITAILVKKEL